MKFDIAQQPFVPAFLTLAVLVVAAVCRGETTVGASPADPCAVWLPAQALASFQTAFPGWAKVICCVLLLSTGIRTGHFAVRYNLYSVNTCIAIPFYGVIACGIAAGQVDLLACIGSMLLAFSLSNFCRSFTANYAFDIIFRASLYLSIALLLVPQAAPLLLLLPLAIVHFHRTGRETIVAFAGLLLVPLALCYLNWSLGHPFFAPLAAWGGQIIEDEAFFAFFGQIPLSSRLLLGVALLCLIIGIGFLLSSRLSVNSKPRIILYYNIEVLLLAASVLCLPGASLPLFALAAVPGAVLLPVFFVCAYRSIVRTVYVLLLVGALVNLFLQ